MMLTLFVELDMKMNSLIGATFYAGDQISSEMQLIAICIAESHYSV